MIEEIGQWATIVNLGVAKATLAPKVDLNFYNLNKKKI
jgi:hypothetical protein